jgi:acetyl esterase/lipase
MQPESSLVYKKTEEGDLQIHIFNPPDHDERSPRPAIVFFHGGGWNGGSPGQFYPHCRYLASRGMVAISAEYRLKTVHGTTPIECVKDGKSAVRWLRSHAADLGIDLGRLAAGGGSAGGHVAAAAGTLTGYDEPDEDVHVSSRPDALVLFNPVYDNGPNGYGYERVKAYYESISPFHNITGNAPPTVVFLGTEDRLIPVATTEEYKARMEAAGCRCDLHLYAGQPHGFFNYREGQNEYYARTVREADRFLAALGYVEGPPTL